MLLSWKTPSCEVVWLVPGGRIFRGRVSEDILKVFELVQEELFAAGDALSACRIGKRPGVFRRLVVDDIYGIDAFRFPILMVMKRVLIVITIMNVEGDVELGLYLNTGT